MHLVLYSYIVRYHVYIYNSDKLLGNSMLDWCHHHVHKMGTIRCLFFSLKENPSLCCVLFEYSIMKKSSLLWYPNYIHNLQGISARYLHTYLQWRLLVHSFFVLVLILFQDMRYWRTMRLQNKKYKQTPFSACFVNVMMTSIKHWITQSSIRIIYHLVYTWHLESPFIKHRRYKKMTELKK